MAAHRLARAYGGRPSAYLGHGEAMLALLVDVAAEALGTAAEDEAIGPALRAGNVQLVLPVRG